MSAITTAVASINEMNHRIADAANEQSGVVEDLNRNVMAIRDTGRNTSAGAQQISANMVQLATLTANLQGELQRFHL